MSAWQYPLWSRQGCWLQMNSSESHVAVLAAEEQRGGYGKVILGISGRRSGRKASSCGRGEVRRVADLLAAFEGRPSAFNVWFCAGLRLARGRGRV